MDEVSENEAGAATAQLRVSSKAYNTDQTTVALPVIDLQQRPRFRLRFLRVRGHTTAKFDLPMRRRSAAEGCRSGSNTDFNLMLAYSNNDFFREEQKALKPFQPGLFDNLPGR